MSQSFTEDPYSQGTAADTTLGNMENNDLALKSGFSGVGAPANAVVGMVWADTTDEIFKIRNFDDDAWWARLVGDASTKLWIYRNDANPGMTIDSSVTDRVLALKGGAGLYNANGGTTAGETWANLKAHTHTLSHTHSHNHKWYNYTDTTHDDQTYNSSGSAVTLPVTTKNNPTYKSILVEATESAALNDAYTDTSAEAASTTTTSGQSTADVRPAAALGTLQYPDV